MQEKHRHCRYVKVMSKQVFGHKLTYWTNFGMMMMLEGNSGNHQSYYDPSWGGHGNPSNSWNHKYEPHSGDRWQVSKLLNWDAEIRCSLSELKFLHVCCACRLVKQWGVCHPRNPGSTLASVHLENNLLEVERIPPHAFSCLSDAQGLVLYPQQGHS